MSYEFGSALYRTSSEFHAAIAESYMNAGGLNDEEDIRRFFAEQSDEELADDAIKGWELADNPDFDRTELVSAIRDLRANY